jgi:threonyl-tRNA synthetase
MIKIKLPDGSIREEKEGVTALEIAESISKSLAKASIACKVNGEQRDIYLPIEEDCSLQILTANDDEGLDVLRHTIAAQVLAKALKELYPGTKLAIGPTIDTGFYYDVLSSHKITPEDFPKIEDKMREIIKSNKKVERQMWDKKDAINLFLSRGEEYKAEIIKGADESDTTEKGKVSLYKQGENDNDEAFFDLCRGPHLTATSKIPLDGFKLTKVSGAYWKGDSNNQQLQRIYGTAWKDKKDLKKYLHMVEEAEKRDHRKIGKEIGLFHIQDEAVGQIFWHHKGWSIFRILENYIREKIFENGYEEVKTPILVDRKLWEESGHWSKFREMMFTSESDEDRVLAIKPMNCPCHVQIFNQGTISYRDLPIRMSEFGSCHRNEPSGALHGLMRVRGFTQDDAHIFCMEDQIESEVASFCNLLLDIYKELGFDKVKVKFSDRPEVRAGNDETWDKSEEALKNAVEATGLEWTLNPGEGAFYGPKLEFVLTDAIGRDWQCGTLQVDFVLPERLDANYIGSDDQKHRPVMLHRAILGSFERFIGILIEQYAGRFPLWMAPEQVAICTITEKHNEYAETIEAQLKKLGFRVKTDLRNEKISYKIREHSNQKIPVIFTIGDREMENNSVNIRRLGSKSQETVDLTVAISKLKEEVENKEIFNKD